MVTTFKESLWYLSFCHFSSTSDADGARRGILCCQKQNNIHIAGAVASFIMPYKWIIKNSSQIKSCILMKCSPPSGENSFSLFKGTIRLHNQEKYSCSLTVYSLLPTGRMFDVSATSRWGMHGLIENELSATPCSVTFTAALYNGP